MITGLSLTLPAFFPARFSFFTLCVFSLSIGVIADDYKRLESATKRWLDLEQRIAQERNGWKAQKEVLSQSVQVLEGSIEELILTLENLNRVAEIRSSDLAKNLVAYDNQEIAREYYAGKLDEMTELFNRFRASAPLFLRDEMDTAREKLDIADSAALGERSQILIAAFTRIEEFNRSVSIDYVPRELKDGREVMVSVLYWGLARAYAVDPQGTIAWEIVPGADGWVWNERPDIVSPVLELVQIYEQARPPSIQIVPGEILNRLRGEG